MAPDYTYKFAFECPDCSLVFALYENARFCSWCGASINTYEGDDLEGRKHVLIADDAVLTRKENRRHLQEPRVGGDGCARWC